MQLFFYTQHQKLVSLLRQFGTREEKPRVSGDGAEHRQMSLLD